MKKYRRKTYYNGYLPRVAYHIAVTQNSDKILFFLDRQVKQYGELTQNQLQFVFDECVNKKGLNVRPSTAIYVLTQAVERLKEIQES